MGKFCLATGKFAQKKSPEKKNFVFFFLLRPKKGKQARSAGNGIPINRDEVRAPRLRVGGEKIRLLCPTEAFASLVEGRGGRDRAKNYL